MSGGDHLENRSIYIQKDRSLLGSYAFWLSILLMEAVMVLREGALESGKVVHNLQDCFFILSLPIEIARD